MDQYEWKAAFLSQLLGKSGQGIPIIHADILNDALQSADCIWDSGHRGDPAEAADAELDAMADMRR